MFSLLYFYHFHRKLESYPMFIYRTFDEQLRDARIAAACTQFGIELAAFREGLARSNVMLNR